MKGQLKGRSLESTVIASQLGVICLAKIPNGVKYIGGENIALPTGKNRWVPSSVATRSPCDYMGCTVGDGRALAFEAKQCALVKGFRVNDESTFPQHQRDFIQRMGRAGAIAGVLVEATEISEFLWLDWEYLSPHQHCPWPVVPWDSHCWRRLGPTTHAIQFGRLLAVAEKGVA